MRSDICFFGFLPLLAVLAMCSPAQHPPLQPDPPAPEQITILQKQLLELQLRQKETETKLGESKNTLEALSARIKAVEEKQTGLNRQQAGPGAIKTHAPRDARKKAAPAKKKKTSAKKKKKQPRRQE